MCHSYIKWRRNIFRKGLCLSVRLAFWKYLHSFIFCLQGLLRTFYGFCCITIAVSILAFLVSASGYALKKFSAEIPEQIFRQHLFALPLFLLQWDSIGPRFEIWADTKHSFSFYFFSIPTLYLLLMATTVFAQINRYMSTVLSVEAGPLECQLVTAATKTIVLLVSLLYFNAPPYPPLMVWAGVVMQLIGSLMYAKLTTVVTLETSQHPANTHLSRMTHHATLVNKVRIAPPLCWQYMLRRVLTITYNPIVIGYYGWGYGRGGHSKFAKSFTVRYDKKSNI